LTDAKFLGSKVNQAIIDPNSLAKTPALNLFRNSLRVLES
jgi:hypothetical protein